MIFFWKELSFYHKNYRYDESASAAATLKDSGVPLIGLDESGYHAVGLSDDNGYYYIISKLVNAFDISVLSANQTFHGILFFIGIIVALTCFMVMFKNWIIRALSIPGFCILAYLSQKHMSIYTCSFSALAATIPLFLLYSRRSYSKPRLIASLLWSGIFLGYCNFIRSGAGTAALIFIVLWLVLYQKFNLKQKALYLSALLFPLSISFFHSNTLKSQRDAFLSQHISKEYYYHPVHGFHPQEEMFLTDPNPSFPFWHLMYIGLEGYSTPHHNKPSDLLSINTVLKEDPKIRYLSKEYEQTLKKEYFNFVKSDFSSTIKIYVKKFIKIAIFCFLYSNIGLLLVFYVRPSWRLLIPFVVTSLFSLLTPLLIHPDERYALSLISLSLLFGIYFTCLGVEKYFHELSPAPASQENLNTYAT